MRFGLFIMPDGRVVRGRVTCSWRSETGVSVAIWSYRTIRFEREPVCILEEPRLSPANE